MGRDIVVGPARVMSVNVVYAADPHPNRDRMLSSPGTLWVPIYLSVSAPGSFSEGFLR